MERNLNPLNVGVDIGSRGRFSSSAGGCSGLLVGSGFAGSGDGCCLTESSAFGFRGSGCARTASGSTSIVKASRINRFAVVIERIMGNIGSNLLMVRRRYATHSRHFCLESGVQSTDFSRVFIGRERAQLKSVL